MEKRLRGFWRRGFDPSWRLDETYVKVRGKWTYLYRAVSGATRSISPVADPQRQGSEAVPGALRGLEATESLPHAQYQ